MTAMRGGRGRLVHVWRVLQLGLFNEVLARHQVPRPRDRADPAH